MKGAVFHHLAEVERRLQAAPGIALFLDFDGTLTPFDDDPSAVYLSEPAKQILRRLTARRDMVTTIVSGRELVDLQPRVGVPGVIYAANHGLEISGPQCALVEPVAVEHSRTLRGLTTDLAQRLQSIPGVWVENKGLTASVHYRRVAESQADEVRRLVHGALASADHPFRLTTGDKVFEIRPRVDWTKGHAVRWIRERTAPGYLAVYLGDATTDEEAFAMLSDEIAIKVGASQKTAAQYCVAGPEQALDFLAWLSELQPARA